MTDIAGRLDSEGGAVPGVDRVVALARHRGLWAEKVRDLKYRRDVATVSDLADLMAAAAPSADVVTWVPCTRAHRQRRGFDPAELLARAVARRRGVRARRLLRRFDRLPQTRRDRSGRRAGPRLVASGSRRRHPGPTVLVVDDVCTTGSTLAAAARALREWGAAAVVAVVVTRASMWFDFGRDLLRCPDDVGPGGRAWRSPSAVGTRR